MGSYPDTERTPSVYEIYGVGMERLSVRRVRAYARVLCCEFGWGRRTIVALGVLRILGCDTFAGNVRQTMRATREYHLLYSRSWMNIIFAGAREHTHTHVHSRTHTHTHTHTLIHSADTRISDRATQARAPHAVHRRSRECVCMCVLYALSGVCELVCVYVFTHKAFEWRNETETTSV